MADCALVSASSCRIEELRRLTRHGGAWSYCEDVKAVRRRHVTAGPADADLEVLSIRPEKKKYPTQGTYNFALVCVLRTSPGY